MISSSFHDPGAAVYIYRKRNLTLEYHGAWSKVKDEELRHSRALLIPEQHMGVYFDCDGGSQDLSIESAFHYRNLPNTDVDNTIGDGDFYISLGPEHQLPRTPLRAGFWIWMCAALSSLVEVAEANIFRGPRIPEIPRTSRVGS